MKYLLKNAKIYENGAMHTADMLLSGAALSRFSGSVNDATVIENCIILPGFCDVHVHFREPGFSYKETIATGSRAAARGGYTAALTMPNLKPTPDSRENLKLQLDAINSDAVIKVIPYGTITKGERGLELSDMEDIAEDVIGFSDDGRGVQSEAMMEEAMRRAHKLGKMIVAHCEDDSLLNGGYVHDGEYARANGHAGISSESEWAPIKRDIKLLEKTGSAYHVCHISSKESVEAIREARTRGINISCETGPHYLTMDDSMLKDDGRFKMNPPIRARDDRDALVAGLLDGTIELIATDHAPHSAEEKSRGLAGSLMGVVGLETAFPVLYTDLVETGKVPLELIAAALSDNPRKRFGIDSDPGFTIFETGIKYTVDPEDFVSRGKASPFEGKEVHARCLATVYEGRLVYRDNKIIK